MEKKKVSLDEVLKREDVNTFEKAASDHKEKKEALSDAERLRKMKEGAGRPKKSAAEKAKPRTLYINDEEFGLFERLAKFNNMTFAELVKTVLHKEAKRDGIY